MILKKIEDICEMIEVCTIMFYLFIDLALSQVAGEYGSSREPDVLTAKCQNLRVIIEKVHR